MEFITYTSKLSKEFLLQYNIFISPKALICEGVKLYWGVKVYGDSRILSNVELHSNAEVCNSEIGEGCKIFASIIKDCEIGNKCVIKPFSNLNCSKIADECTIGNFTSISNCTIGAKANINSLCSINNLECGANLIMGSGTCCECLKDNSITIGDNVSIGANSTIIKPVIISDNATIQANSVITKDIEVGQQATNNIKQTNK